MSVYKRAKSPFWQFDFWARGDRVVGSFSGKDGRPCVRTDRPRKEAEQAEAILRARAQQPADGFQRLGLEETLIRYWTEIAQFQKNKRTVWTQLKHLARLLGKLTKIDKIDDAAIARYVAVRRTEKARGKESTVAPATINRELELLSRIFKRARKPWRLKLHPDGIEWRDHKLKEPQERTRTLTLDEDDALFATMAKERPDFCDVWEFKLLTGKRLNEVIRLRKSKVDRRTMTARVVQKGGDEIVIALTPTTLAIIDRNWMHHAVYVFTYASKTSSTRTKADGRVEAVRKGDRRPYTQDGWRKQMEAILEKAGISDFRMHDLRHTAGTRMYEATGDLKAVQTALGHKNIHTTTKYVHAGTERNRAALQAAERVRVPETSRTEAATDGKKEGSSNG